MDMRKAMAIFTFLSYFSLGFAKLSVLFFYKRIFVGRIFNIVTWIFIAIVFLWMWIFGLVWIFSCGGNFRYLWGTIQDTESHCLNVFDEWTAGSAIDFIMDLFIFTLPTVMVWQLKMPTRRKLVVIATFLTGAV